MSTDQYINLSIEDKVGIISIYNKKGNSLTKKMLNDFSKGINELSKEDINCIVINSDYNGIFCSGASFDELLGINTFIESEDFFFGFANLLNSMRKSSKIIISKVDGKVVGGGVGIVCASDYVLANNRSCVKLSEISIGLGPFVIQPAIERRIGINNFNELTLFPKEWKDSNWCYEKGIFNKIFSKSDNLEEYLQNMIEDFSSYNILTLENIKKSIWEKYEDWDNLLYEKAEKTAKLVLSSGVKDILEKFKQ